MPISHYGNKNILVMVDHVTSWPMVKAIPDKEATPVANAIFHKLILQHGSPQIFLSDNGKEFSNDTLAYVCQEFGMEQHFTSPTIPDPMARQIILTSFSRPQYENCVKKTKAYGTESFIRFYSHIGDAHTPPLLRLHTHLCITETLQYPSTK